MRLISINNCQAGMKLAKPILKDNGNILVSADIELTSRMISQLQKQHVSILYIQDKNTDDLIINDAISPQVRQEAINTIKSTFSKLEQGKHKWNNSLDKNFANDFKNIFKKLSEELKQNKQAINLLTNIQVNDNEIFSHSLNVTLYAMAVAIKQGYNDKQLSEIGIGTLLHDIGKMMIPSEILNKPGKLTNDEFEIVKKHTEIGFEILRKNHDIPLLSAHCAYQHHEKLDGTGYPRKLKGNEIHQYAKIIAVADVFDALTTHRAYRKAMLPHLAMEIIFSDTGKHFDLEIVRTFRNTISIYPPGVTVKLSTGETGVVVRNNVDALARPVVRIIRNESGENTNQPNDIDLSKNLSIMITECDTIL